MPCSLRLGFIGKSVTSAPREARNRQVAVRLRITHKAECLVEVRGRFSPSLDAGEGIECSSTGLA